MLGLLGEFLNALNMRAEFINGEFGVLLGEDHGFDQVEEKLGDVLFGHELGETEMNQVHVGHLARVVVVLFHILVLHQSICSVIRIHTRLISGSLHPRVHSWNWTGRYRFITAIGSSVVLV